MINKVMLSFSGGKDSVLALHRLVNNPDYEVAALLITMSEDYKRSSIHGIREKLIDLQAQSLGFPVKKVYLPNPCPNDTYEKIMNDVTNEAIDNGMTHMAFGDIFLEDIKAYREKNLSQTPITPIFPLWGEPTEQLINQFIKLGYKTIITTIDPKKLPESFLGKVMTKDLIQQLPKSVDSCGENGEFHTFVFDGPLFHRPIPVRLLDEIIKSEYYSYRDLDI